MSGDEHESLFDHDDFCRAAHRGCGNRLHVERRYANLRTSCHADVGASHYEHRHGHTAADDSAHSSTLASVDFIINQLPGDDTDTDTYHCGHG